MLIFPRDDLIVYLLVGLKGYPPQEGGSAALKLPGLRKQYCLENYHFTVEHISYFLLGFGLKSKRKNHQV